MTPVLEVAARLLAVASLVYIGLLPRIFFRPGRRNPRWWLNAVPFWISGATVLGVLTGSISWVETLPGAALSGPTQRLALSLGALAATVSSLLLIRVTVAAHRSPLALWHQDDDAPDHVVTHGPYARVRHPFYSAFLLALTGCALAVPHPLTALALVLGFARLRGTAMREEARFMGSAVADAYAAYARDTGRFVPIPARRAADDGGPGRRSADMPG